MSNLNISFAGATRPIRKTILSVLIGLMGGGVAVLAQQAPEAAVASPAQTEVAPAASQTEVVAQAAPAQAAQAEPASAAAPAAPADAAPASTQADSVPASAPAADSIPATAPSTVAPQAESAPTPTATPVAAAVGKNGKPLKASAKKDKKKKEKAPKLTPVSISQGTLTIDGWTGKARLNYDIADLKYIYMWAPGVGTVVVSNIKFPLGKEEPNAFAGNSLTVDANGHTIQLCSEKKLLKDKKPESAWVYVDTVYKFSSPYPTMGYGNTMDAPYVWPGAKDVQVAKAGVAIPPPLPASMRPTLAKQACVPAGSKAAGTPCSVATAAAAVSVAPAAPTNSSPAATPAPEAPASTASAPAPQNQ